MRSFLLRASTVAAGVIAAVLIGVGMGAEADVMPWLLAKYFGLRSFSTLYAWTWTAYAIGPVIRGKAFDATASYKALLMELGALTARAASFMLFMPRYENALVYAEPVRAAAV